MSKLKENPRKRKSRIQDKFWNSKSRIIYLNFLFWATRKEGRDNLKRNRHVKGNYSWKEIHVSVFPVTQKTKVRQYSPGWCSTSVCLANRKGSSTFHAACEKLWRQHGTFSMRQTNIRQQAIHNSISYVVSNFFFCDSHPQDFFQSY